MRNRACFCLLVMVISFSFQSAFCIYPAISAIAATSANPSTRQSQAPSFDCTKASSKSEQLICSDKELSEADLKLSQLYKQVFKASADKDALKKEQQAWIKDRRDQCSDAPCMIQAYQERITSLEKSLPAAPGGLTGTYNSGNSELEILQMPDGTLKFNITASRTGDSPNQTNVGATCGETRVDNDLAIFYDKGNDCVLVMQFNKDKTLTVYQKGSCGFGMNVDASGLYKQTKGTAPKINCNKQ